VPAKITYMLFISNLGACMVPETFDTKLTDSNKIRNKFFLNDFFRQNFENLNDNGELDGDERDGIACRRKRKTF
jgi:hypothetical protein